MGVYMGNLSSRTLLTHFVNNDVPSVVDDDLKLHVTLLRERASIHDGC